MQGSLTPAVTTTQRICTSPDFPPPPSRRPVYRRGTAVLLLTSPSCERSAAADSTGSRFRRTLGAHWSEVTKRSCGSPTTLTHCPSWPRGPSTSASCRRTRTRTRTGGTCRQDGRRAARTQLSWADEGQEAGVARVPQADGLVPGARWRRYSAAAAGRRRPLQPRG